MLAIVLTKNDDQSPPHFKPTTEFSSVTEFTTSETDKIRSVLDRHNYGQLSAKLVENSNLDIMNQNTIVWKWLYYFLVERQGHFQPTQLYLGKDPNETLMGFSDLFAGCHFTTGMSQAKVKLVSITEFFDCAMSFLFDTTQPTLTLRALPNELMLPALAIKVIKAIRNWSRNDWSIEIQPGERNAWKLFKQPRRFYNHYYEQHHPLIAQDVKQFFMQSLVPDRPKPSVPVLPIATDDTINYLPTALDILQRYSGKKDKKDKSYSFAVFLLRYLIVLLIKYNGNCGLAKDKWLSIQYRKSDATGKKHGYWGKTFSQLQSIWMTFQKFSNWYCCSVAPDTRIAVGVYVNYIREHYDRRYSTPEARKFCSLMFPFIETPVCSNCVSTTLLGQNYCGCELGINKLLREIATSSITMSGDIAVPVEYSYLTMPQAAAVMPHRHASAIVSQPSTPASGIMFDRFSLSSPSTSVSLLLGSSRSAASLPNPMPSPLPLAASIASPSSPTSATSSQFNLPIPIMSPPNVVQNLTEFEADDTF